MTVNESRRVAFAFRGVWVSTCIKDVDDASESMNLDVWVGESHAYMVIITFSVYSFSWYHRFPPPIYQRSSSSTVTVAMPSGAPSAMTPLTLTSSFLTLLP